MTNRFMISVAAIAVIASAGLANAQGTSGGQSGPSAAQSGSPSTSTGGMSGGAASGGTSMQQRDTSDTSKSGSGAMKSTESDQKSAAGSQSHRADDMQKSKSTSSETDSKGIRKDMKAEGRDSHNGNMKAEGRESRDGNMKAEGREDRTHSSTTTTGQAGAGAKLTTEQRTRITTVIRDQHIAPVTNVNFSISVGTRVPRTVSFHPLPTEVVSVYPEWRGYEFILVREQIVVVNPRTLEIVAILDV